MKRLAIVVSHPTQYYSPWFRQVARDGSVAIRVFYLWDSGIRPTRDRGFGETFTWDTDLLSGYDHEFVPNASADPGTHHFRGLSNPSLPSRVRAWKADCILLFGYRYLSHLRLIAWARARGIPLLFRGDSHRIGRGRPGLASRLALGLLYAQFDAFLCVGEANRDYFRAFGVAQERLFFAPHSVDAAHFDPTGDACEQARRLKESLGLADRRVVLFAGKFVEAKQPLALLEAFIALSRPGWSILFVGDGAERPALERRASSAGAPVRLLGFANQGEMPSRYLLADLFVLPSKGLYETWGLSVNEAMLMGVPCLVSTRVGCQRDLVIEGNTGWVFDPSEAGSLTRALGKAMSDLEDDRTRASVKKAGAERISRYGYAQTTQGLLAALQSVEVRPEA